MAITTDILSERLSSIRRAAQLSMAQVATACNVSSGSVSNYEGGREPNLTFMKDFCVFFGLSLDNVLDEEFNFDTYVNEILTIVKEKGFFEGYKPLRINSSNNHNITSNIHTRNKGDIIQSQGGYNSKERANEKDFSNEVEMLRQENAFLKKQLEFVNGLLDKAISK